MRNITQLELKNIMDAHQYILLRGKDGFLYGHNCAITKLKRFKDVRLTEETVWIGYRPCNLHEYITEKIPFYSKPKPKVNESSFNLVV